MSGLNNANYVKEFAYRTKLNYYRNMYFYKHKEEYLSKIKEIEIQMKADNYVIEEYYEVTDLINSMVGLLIFPEQNLYNNISNKEADLKKFFPTLFECTNSCDYKNTYEEVASPKNIIRHLRNSFSHDRVMILPTTRKGENQISKIIMQDYKLKDELDKTPQEKGAIRRTINQSSEDIRDLNFDNEIYIFSIDIPIELFEKVVMEICDYALKRSKE